MMNPSGNQFSKEFFDLVKSIGETHSKQEEDRIITAEVQTLKCRLMEADISPCKMREYLVRAIYIEMLGHPAPFAYIHAVKLTQNKNLLCKRIGYLLCSLCLDPNHELLLLLINTIQKVLIRDNGIFFLLLNPFVLLSINLRIWKVVTIWKWMRLCLLFANYLVKK